MDAISKAYDRLIAGLALAAGLIVLGIFALIVVDVSMREAGYHPPGFTVAFVEYGLLFFTMFAAPWLVRHKGHIFVDAFTSQLPWQVIRVSEKVVYLICIVCMAICAAVSAQLLIEAAGSDSVDMRGIVDIPEWVMFVPLPFCFALMMIEFGRFLIGRDSLYARRDTTSERF
ncbi:MAG: TRAP transporter small permease [Rhodospirillaceae bacterium]